VPGVEQIKPRIAVVFGGRGAGHEVSCVSAAGVLAALDPDEFEVVPVGIATDDRWVLGGPLALTAGPDTGAEVVDARAGGRVLAGVDVVFPVLPGESGEEGTVQGLLEMAGVPYVGAGVLTAAAATDREFIRKIVAADGVPVAPWVALRPHHELPAVELPVRVVPARGAGGTVVHDAADLPEAIAAARAVDPKVLVESVVAGATVSCGVLDGEHGGPAEASVPVPEGPYAQRVRELAVLVYTALDCTGLARVDFVVDEAGEIFFTGLDTMPPLAAEESFARMWERSGLDYRKLLSRVVRTALRRGGSGLR
jgi:D-alanine-D-alanine ligase